MPDTATAPRFHGGAAITFEERPVPEPGPGQLLIRVAANAICGTDRGQYFDGSAVTPGHEAAGRSRPQDQEPPWPRALAGSCS